MVSGWAETESTISLVPSPAVSHCFPLSTHSLKQSAIFIHHRKGGNYVWPTDSLTPPLSQLNGKHRQSWPSTPCPCNISTALCFLNLSCHGWGRTFTSNLLKANLRLIWLWKQSRAMGKRRSSLTYRRAWVSGSEKKKKKGHSFRNHNEFLKTALEGGGISRRPQTHLCSLKSEHTFCRKTEKKTATRHDTE